MPFWQKSISILLLLVGPAVKLWAADPPDEEHAFKAAEKLLADGLYEHAEKDFKNFVQVYTNSAHLPQAILNQAQALFLQTNYTAAIEVLSSHQNMAGTNADQYLFLLAEAQFQKGQHAAAADAFAKLAKDFPASTRRLEAAVREATAKAKLNDWKSVVALLQQTNGVFQSATRTNTNDKDMVQVVQGYLLLSEAELAQRNFEAAELALQPLSKLQLQPGPSWQWNYLLGRIRLAQGKNEEALRNATNMLGLVVISPQLNLQADTFAFQAGILERLLRPKEAIAAYTNNLSGAVPAEHQRQALLKITELSLAQNDIANALNMLDKFLKQYPAAPAADVAWLTLGELQLRQSLGNLLINTTNTPGSTNLLQQAQASFQAVAKFPQSAFFGKGQFDLGWCFWLQNKMPECENAFQMAVERLPFSSDQATAFFKLADAQLQQNKFAQSLSNYNSVLEKFAVLPEVRTNLFEAALYQSARAALAAGQPSAATNALAKLLAGYPKGFHTEHGILLVGQQISQLGRPEEARKIFSDFIAAAPESRLLPEVRLAIARTFEKQEKWGDAINQYESWLALYTNHDARPAVLYYQGHACGLARRETNAFSLFNQLVTKFPTNEFATLAQWWLADHYYQQGDFKSAEINFQELFQKWPASEWANQARMMAGRSAVARAEGSSLASAWTDAIGYFTNLTGDPRNPLWSEAMFAYGDALVSRGPITNKLADYDTAIRVFNQLCQPSPTNTQGVLAWGRLAGCYFQWAHLPGQGESLTNAINAFQKVIDSDYADATARSIAKVGLGVVFESQALLKPPGEEQKALWKLALGNYLQVFNEGHLRKGEKPDLWWTQYAGLNAGRLAEKLQWWVEAINVYQRLKVLLPPLSASCDNRIRKAQEHLPTAKID